MIEKQREKEFLFELERICHNYYLVVTCTEDGKLELTDVDFGYPGLSTTNIERRIDGLRVKTLEDVR